MEKTDTLEYQRDEHRVHLLVYHLLWCPRRRKPILTGTLKDRFEELVKMKCQEKGWVILTTGNSTRSSSSLCACVAVRECLRRGEGNKRYYFFSSAEGISTHLE